MNYIIQHGTEEYRDILASVQTVNHAYASKFGFEYMNDVSRLGSVDCKSGWEKLAFISSFLATVNDGSLVIWEDADSLNIGNEDPTGILSLDNSIGMVRMYGGLRNMTPVNNRYNSGVIAIRNSDSVRKLFVKLLASSAVDDESAFALESKAGLKISDLDPKWNCWNNNKHLCEAPVIISWHGYNITDKLKLIQDQLK